MKFTLFNYLREYKQKYNGGDFIINKQIKTEVEYDKEINTFFIKIPDSIKGYGENEWFAIVGIPPNVNVYSSTHLIEGKQSVMEGSQNYKAIEKLEKLSKK